MADESLSGKQLEKALLEGKLSESSPSSSFTAYVRTSEEDGHVAVGVSGCEGFGDVPIDVISEAEEVDHVTCGDHEHLRMRITLAKLNDPIVRVLTSLLDQVGKRLRAVYRRVTSTAA